MLELNYRFKMMYSPDYEAADTGAALADFRVRRRKKKKEGDGARARAGFFFGTVLAVEKLMLPPFLSTGSNQEL